MADHTVPAGGRDQHVVQFFGSDDDLADRVSSYLAAGLRRGETAVIIATAAHIRAVQARLEAVPGFPAARADGRFTALDADQALGQILAGVPPSPSPLALEQLAGGLVREALATGPGACLYGEMVALLWNAGRPDAAIALEALCASLGQRLPIRMLCGYPAQLAAENARVLRSICDLHTAVAGIPPQP
jgi:hypothetical protein